MRHRISREPLRFDLKSTNYYKKQQKTANPQSKNFVNQTRPSSGRPTIHTHTQLWMLSSIMMIDCSKKCDPIENQNSSRQKSNINTFSDQNVGRYQLISFENLNSFSWVYVSFLNDSSMFVGCKQK